MEDEDSKIRRNFLAASVLVVLAWWLQAPLDKISEKLLGMPSVGAAFEWRAWLAATVALLYFALRFRFSKEHAEAWGDLRKEASTVQQRLLLRWLQWETSWFVRWGWTPPVFGDGFVTIAKGGLPNVEVERSPITSIEVPHLMFGKQDLAGQWIAPKDGQIFGSARVRVERVNGNTSEGIIHDGIGFELNAPQRRIFKAWAYAWLAVYSKASTSLLVPWLLGTAALAICVHKQLGAW